MNNVLNVECDCPNHEICSCCHINSDKKCFGNFQRYSIIKASAGTGKTYQLATRFVQLLALGVQPETILALTFTRKAAGEIYNRIITRMMDMWDKDMLCCSPERRKIIEMLRNLLNPEKTVQISTIDSFFTKLLTSFGPELGIWGQNSLIDYEDNRYRRDVIQSWIPEISKNHEEINELRELLKTMNNNQESVMLETSLLALMDKMYEKYLQYENTDGNAISWGCAMDISPDPYANTPEAYQTDLDFLVQNTGILITKQGKEKINATYQKRLSSFIEFAATIRTEYIGIIPDNAKKLFSDNLLKYNAPGWCIDTDTLHYSSSETIPNNVAECIRKIFRHIAYLALVHAEKRTDAIHRLLRKFDETYTLKIRNYGKLTFTDLPYLLAKSSPDGSGPIAGNSMESLEYRLDSKILHYMFDEFQDTSDSQWRIFDRMTSNQLLSCIPDDFRSFFCVGDIKQSIYGWRGGDPKLFRYLENKTNVLGKELGYCPTSTLTKSYRSSQNVLNLINHVFTTCSNNEPDCLKDIEFETHTAAKNLSGFSALLVMCKPEENPDIDIIDVNTFVIFRILQKIQPRERGLSVGILVQSNKNANIYLEKLKSLASISNSSMEFSADGYAPLMDTAAFYALRQLLILSAHPGDKNAIEYLRMMVFCDESTKKITAPMSMESLQKKLKLDDTDSEDLGSAVRHFIARNGIAAFIERFISSFEGLSKRDCAKLESIRRLADEFNGTTDEFLISLEKARGDEKSLVNTVQIMTIHKSKGLEFDILFTPDLGNPKGYSGMSQELMVDIPDPIMQYSSEFPHPQWISYFPNDIFMEHIPAYMEYKKKKKLEDEFAKLCKTYVALTRAKRAIFVMVQPPNNPVRFAPDKWIHDKLKSVNGQEKESNLAFFRDIGEENMIGEIPFTCGQSEWYQEIPMNNERRSHNIQQEDVPREVEMIFPVQHTRIASKEHLLKIDISTENRFSFKSITETGTQVHQLFEHIDFLSDDWNADDFFHEYLTDKQKQDSVLAMEIIRNSTKKGCAVYNALLYPDGSPQLWKEKRFLLINEANEVIPGAFDRVLVWRNSQGIPQRAEIYDYKSDALNDPAEFLERHQGQLNLYRKSLAKMLNIEESCITCKILALRPCLVIDVPR